MTYQRSLHMHLRRQGSIPRLPTTPTNSQATGTATTSTAVTRRDSHEDIEAQRGTFPAQFLFAANHYRSARGDRSGLFGEREPGCVL